MKACRFRMSKVHLAMWLETFVLVFVTVGGGGANEIIA